MPEESANDSPEPSGDPSGGFTVAELVSDSVRLQEEQRGSRSVIGSALLISAATFLSRFLGLARDILMAALFGFSAGMDAFFLAFTIPNLFRKLFGEGALASATIPVLTRYRITNDKASTRRYLGTLSTILFLGLGGVTVLILGAAWLIPSDLFGDATKYETFRMFLTVLLPYVVFICLAALQSGALNCYNRFGIPALMPALANLMWIGVLVYLFYAGLDVSAGILVMAVGVLTTGMIQWGAQLPAMSKLKLLAKPQLKLSDKGVRDTFKAMAPMLFALAVFQVNVFLDQVLAEMLVEGDGAVSSYSFASRLFQFPLGLVGVALSTAMFPLMSRFAASKELEKLTASLLNSARLLLFISLPAAFGLAALAYPITELLYGGANSTPEMLQRSARVVMLLAVSLPIVSLISLLTKSCYAMRDYKTPTRIALMAVAVNIIANVILLQTDLKEAGLALGTAISGTLNLALLIFALRKKLSGTILESMRAAAIPQTSERMAQPMSPSRVKAIPFSVARSFVVAALMSAAALLVERALYGQWGIPGRWSRMLSTLSGVGTGVAVYVSLSMLMKAPEVGQVLSLRKRRKK
ncbi:murein biosynthesis integral membrane protein MurJ [Planctomycetota bacterium]|nr:murein biosynthesis integral membrane protein MurJ [Planctomycetota bacterium]